MADSRFRRLATWWFGPRSLNEVLNAWLVVILVWTLGIPFGGTWGVVARVLVGVIVVEALCRTAYWAWRRRARDRSSSGGASETVP